MCLVAEREITCVKSGVCAVCAQVAVQANSAAGREKASLESRAAKAKAKLDAAREKAEAVEKAPLPKIEVGGVISNPLHRCCV
jgi:hypothetical protein